MKFTVQIANSRQNFSFESLFAGLRLFSGLSLLVFVRIRFLILVLTVFFPMLSAAVDEKDVQSVEPLETIEWPTRNLQVWNRSATDPESIAMHAELELIYRGIRSAFYSTYSLVSEDVLLSEVSYNLDPFEDRSGESVRLLYRRMAKEHMPHSADLHRDEFRSAWIENLNGIHRELINMRTALSDKGLPTHAKLEAIINEVDVLRKMMFEVRGPRSRAEYFADVIKVGNPIILEIASAVDRVQYQYGEPELPLTEMELEFTSPKMVYNVLSYDGVWGLEFFKLVTRLIVNGTLTVHMRTHLVAFVLEKYDLSKIPFFAFTSKCLLVGQTDSKKDCAESGFLDIAMQTYKDFARSYDASVSDLNSKIHRDYLDDEQLVPHGRGAQAVIDHEKEYRKQLLRILAGVHKLNALSQTVAEHVSKDPKNRNVTSIFGSGPRMRKVVRLVDDSLKTTDLPCAELIQLFPTGKNAGPGRPDGSSEE
jgi:hypothetical protein